jgi:hypothetical protein
MEPLVSVDWVAGNRDDPDRPCCSIAAPTAEHFEDVGGGLGIGPRGTTSWRSGRRKP